MNTSQAEYELYLKERERLLAEIERLKAENAELRRKLALKSPDPQPEEQRPVTPPTAMRRLSPEEKVALFQRIFHGREDVFARRWYSQATGKAGYQPVCAREWNPEFCDKRKYKCADCPNRAFAPLRYTDLFNHLSGKDEYCRDVVGIYALTKQDECYFLCADFDDKNCRHGFKEDVKAYREICKEWSIPTYVEISRSGKGAHVWIFFQEAVPATKARKLGNMVLTEAMTRNYKMTFRSYDRFIPNQDHLPAGGLGNLVALPLQGKVRKEGRSVFVDDLFVPFQDQWECLLSIKSLTASDVDHIIGAHNQQPVMAEVSRSNERQPWETPLPPQITSADFPRHLEITRANMLFIPLQGLSARIVNHLKRTASFKNPEFYKRQALRLSTYNVPRIICCANLDETFLALPRGCEDAVVEMLHDSSIPFTLKDATNPGRAITADFKGTLRTEQERALRALAAHSAGVLSASTAFGKTVVAMALIAEKKVNTLVLVHTKALQNQWKERMATFLDSMGKGDVDVVTMQSCLTEDGVKPFVRDYGMVIVDECHHVSSVTFERVLKYTNARFVYGLTATPMRKDGQQPIIFMQCGNIRYNADTRQQADNQNFIRYLVPRYTPARLLSTEESSYSQTIRELSEDKIRNALIVKDVLETVTAGRCPIVLTSLTSHVHLLADMLENEDCQVISLVGAESAKEKRRKMDTLKGIAPAEKMVIVATGKYVGEGFDYPRLDSLFLALPVSWKGLLAQYAGRLHRTYPGKKEVRIYDYVDLHIPVCESMYRKRIHAYASIGYQLFQEQILEPLTKQDSANVIFDERNFLPSFLTDLRSAKQNIIISCPHMKLPLQEDIVTELIKKSLEGIKVIIYTPVMKAAYTDLRHQGIDIRIKDSLKLSCVILDKACIWYGNMNFISSNAGSAGNAIRFCDNAVAASLLEILYDSI